MQVIKMYPEIFELILKGKKSSTIRLGVKKYTLGPCLVKAIDKNGETLMEWKNAKIVGLSIVKFKYIGSYHAFLEGYDNADDLVSTLKNIYQNINDDDDMTLVRFE